MSAKVKAFNPYSLTSLQTVCVWELSLSKDPLSGYDICKALLARGLAISHQQVYRELKKMNLMMTYIAQIGKPDKKVYSLDPEIVYASNIRELRIDFLDKYNVPYLAEQRIKFNQEELDRTNHDVNSYKVHMLSSENTYLEEYIHRQEVRSRKLKDERGCDSFQFEDFVKANTTTPRSVPNNMYLGCEAGVCTWSIRLADPKPEPVDSKLRHSHNLSLGGY